MAMTAVYRGLLIFKYFPPNGTYREMLEITRP